MRAISDEAANKMQRFIQLNGFGNDKAILDYAYSLTAHYGEAIGALSAAMYEATAAAQGMTIAPAIVAQTPEYGEVAKAVHGTMKTSQKMVPKTVARMVKRTGADTTLLNAERDGAQFAWVPTGSETCAFCIVLASRGWQYMSKDAMRNGHAEHIHPNCDCNYSVRFDGKSSVEGYDPEVFWKMYNGADPDGSPDEKINALRRSMSAKRKKLDYGSFETYIYPKKGKQPDTVRPQNIIKDMKKSQAGRDALDYIQKNGIKVQLQYNVSNPDNVYGFYDPIDKKVIVFGDISKTISQSSLTVIHEASHARLGSSLTRKEEVLCFLEEQKHLGNELTPDLIRNIIRSVNNTDVYKDLPWR